MRTRPFTYEVALRAGVLGCLAGIVVFYFTRVLSVDELFLATSASSAVAMGWIALVEPGLRKGKGNRSKARAVVEGLALALVVGVLVGLIF